jgi:vacuolar-type H+-ATPase subunit H
MNESPLITIRGAERAAAELVENAHRLAEREVLTAKTRVASPLAKAEENGRHLANRHHKEELENAQADAEQITKNGGRPLPTRQRPICWRQSRTQRTRAVGPQPQGGMIAMLVPMAKVKSLDLAWRLLSAFPAANLKRIHPEIIDGFRGSLKEQDRFSDLNAKVRALS